ncbi:MAG TPA: hypothetical protein VHS97_12245, partial [Isosphaeraceae bacterium]|nr:hypothetical protein [Isosphaeraceae bacterium]
MKLWRTATIAISWAVCLMIVVTTASPSSALETPGPAPAAALYVASDFPTLSRGFDPGLADEVIVRVWAPAQDEWRVTFSDETVTLHLRSKPGDAIPCWQSLGTVKLAKGRSIKVIASDDRPPSQDRTASAGSSEMALLQGERTSKPVRPAIRLAPVPALLWLASVPQSEAGPALDMIRGRIESVEPPPDSRRTQARTNRQGADFQAPATAQEWRDRAQHLREQMLVALGLWPMFPKTPLRPQVY